MNQRTAAVIKREFKARVMTKGFILMTVLLPLFMLSSFGLPILMEKLEERNRTETTLHVIAESAQIIESVKAAFDSLEYVIDGEFSMTYHTMDSTAFNQFYEDNKQDLVDNKITGLIFVSDNGFNKKEPSFYSSNPNNNKVLFRANGPLNRALIETYFADKEMTPEDLAFARKRVNFTKFRVSEDKDVEEEGFGNQILSFLLTFLLYMSLIIMGSSLLQSVIEEKANRIVEVLLSSVGTMELMTGKIIGAGASGLLQMTIWLIPAFLLAGTSLLPSHQNLYFQLALANCSTFCSTILSG